MSHFINWKPSQHQGQEGKGDSEEEFPSEFSLIWWLLMAVGGGCCPLAMKLRLTAATPKRAMILEGRIADFVIFIVNLPKD